MGAMASQITSFTIVYSTVYSGANQRKHQSSAPLAFVRGIHRRPVNSPHKGPVMRKMFPFDDVIMGSDNGWLHVRHQAIIWTYAALFLIGTLVMFESKENNFRMIDEFASIVSKKVASLHRPRCYFSVVSPANIRTFGLASLLKVYFVWLMFFSVSS